MTQELWDLRKYILAGRYDDALVIVDELELMSRKSYIRNIRSFLIRLIILANIYHFVLSPLSLIILPLYL